MIISLDQSWATQIGPRAKFLLKSYVEGQSIDYYYSFSCIFCEKAIFRAFRRSALKSLKSRIRPAGLRFAHGWSWWLTCCFHREMPVCECDCMIECDVVKARWPGMVGRRTVKNQMIDFQTVWNQSFFSSNFRFPNA